MQEKGSSEITNIRYSARAFVDRTCDAKNRGFVAPVSVEQVGAEIAFRVEAPAWDVRPRSGSWCSDV